MVKIQPLLYEKAVSNGTIQYPCTKLRLTCICRPTSSATLTWRLPMSIRVRMLPTSSSTSNDGEMCRFRLSGDRLNADEAPWNWVDSEESREEGLICWSHIISIDSHHKRMQFAFQSYGRTQLSLRAHRIRTDRAHDERQHSDLSKHHDLEQTSSYEFLRFDRRITRTVAEQGEQQSARSPSYWGRVNGIQKREKE